MVPYYLSVALVSYTVEFTMKNNPNVHALPGQPEVQMAFHPIKPHNCSMKNMDIKQVICTYLYSFLWNLENLPDDKAYQELLDIKLFLPDRQIRPSEIQPLLSAIEKEYKKTNDVQQ